MEKASHIMKFTDENGQEVVIKATSDIKGAQTTMQEDGELRTKVTNK